MTATQKLPMSLHPDTPKHFYPPPELGLFLRSAGLALDGLGDHGRHWLFRNTAANIVAQYWPANARLHIHRDGCAVPNQKFENVSPEQLQEIFENEFQYPPSDRAGKPPLGVLKVGQKPLPMRGPLPEPMAEATLPDYSPADVEHTTAMHERVAALPREELSQLRRNARVKLLASMVGSMMGNHRLYPGDRDGGFNIEELVDKAKAALAAVEAACDKDICDMEDLHGK